jgi:serine/threonine protein kinase
VTSLGGGRYELGAVLGTGGMARVHRATDTVLGRGVAVKIFRDDLDDESAARARTEMQTLASLHHPGLVAVHDAGTSDETHPYLVMELVEGPTLAACCADGTLTPERVAEIGADVASALDYVHGRGVVHRDVKPANILLSHAGAAKLADFGIARIVDGVRHTSTGLTIGTAPYLAPEQVTGQHVGPPADVYALGLVLLECLTGRREYTGGPVETAMARLHRQPAVPETVPEPLRALLLRMTAREPADRPTAGAAAGVLRGDDPATADTTLTQVLAPPTELLSPPTGLLSPPTQLLGSPSPSRSRVPRVASAPAAHPRPAWLAVLLDLTRGTLVRVALAVVVLLVLVAAFASMGAGGGSNGAQPRPSAPVPTTPLEQHLAQLDKAVSR